MPKRKREHDGDDYDSGSSNAARTFAAEFTAQVNLTSQRLVSALKLARGFERQKLGRRQKQASSQPQTLLRLREEVIVLKQLDLEKTAKTHVLKTLCKSKRVRESPTFVKIYGQGPKLETGAKGAVSNVQARLFKSAPAAEAMSGFMSRIYELLQLVDNGNTMRAPKSDPNTVQVMRSRVLATNRLDSFSDEAERDGSTELKASYKDESETEDHLNEQYIDRLAPSDDSNATDSESPSHGSTVSQISLPQTNRPKVVAPPKASSFLPALTATGYYSGSEAGSDAADIRDLEPKPRQNRRGQQERRKIAERKFGKNAKHLQGGNARPVNDRNQGWDAQRGAVQAGEGRGRQRGRGRGMVTDRSQQTEQGRAAVSGRAAGKPSTDQAKTVTGTSHPSWQAAKLRKEQHNPAATFAGKITKFD